MCAHHYLYVKQLFPIIIHVLWSDHNKCSFNSVSVYPEHYYILQYCVTAPLDLNPPEGEVEDWDTGGGEGGGGGGSDRDTLPSMQPESCLETSDLSPDHHRSAKPNFFT